MKLSYVVPTMACMVLITGCVISNSPSKIRNDVKPVEYTSIKNAKNLAFCVSDEWEKKITRAMKVQMRETSNGYSVWVEVSIGSPLIGPLSLNENAIFIADISNTETGSITRYYDNIADDEKYWASDLEKCLNDVSFKSIATHENPIPEPQSSNSVLQKLRELQELKKEGLITEEEFQYKKKKLLDRI